MSKIQGLLDTLKLKLQDSSGTIVQNMIAMTKNSEGDIQLQTVEYLQTLLGGGVVIILNMKAEPNGSEVNGEKYIVTIGINDWFGHDNEIAMLVDDIWTFSVPQEEMLYVNINDEKTYIWYVDHYINVGGSGAELTVKEEGVTVETLVSELNFVGADIEARRTGAGIVTIYCPPPPPPVYSPKFSMANSISTTSRYVSAPTIEGTPFKIGNWSGGSSQSCTNVGNFTYNSIPSFSCETETTTFQCIVYDADGVTHLANHTVTLDGNKVATYTGMVITVTNYGVEENKFKAAVSIAIDYYALMGNMSGRFSVYAVHHNYGTDYTFSQNNIFYDSQTYTMAMDVITFEEVTPVLKYMSGVAGYNVGSTFNVNINDIDYTNSDSYPSTVVSINGSEYNLSTINLPAASLTDWDSQWDNVNASYNNDAWTYSSPSNIYSITSNANVSATSYDWSTVETISSENRTVIFDSLTPTSTRIFRNFKDELYRLDSDLQPWNSAASLTELPN